MSDDATLMLRTSILTSKKYVGLPDNEHRFAFVTLLLMAKKGLERCPSGLLLGHLQMSSRRWKTVRKNLISSGLLNGDGLVNGFEDSQLNKSTLRSRRHRARVRGVPRDVARDVAGTSQKRPKVLSPLHPPLSNSVSSLGSKSSPDPEKSKRIYIREQAKEVLEYVNQKTGRRFQRFQEIERCIIREKATLDQCKTVVDYAWSKFGADPALSHNVNPTTPFRPCHFQKYLDEHQAGPGRGATGATQDERIARLK